MSDEQLPTISIDQLAVGLYVHVGLRWMDHPFAFNHFKIQTPEQIQTLRSLGVTHFQFDPERSDIPPPAPGSEPPPQPATPSPPPGEDPIVKAKLARLERIKKQKEAINACEKRFQNAATTVKSIAKNLFARPEQAVKQAHDMVTEMVNSVLTDRDVAIHLMNDKLAGEEMYVHSLNVSMLSVILGKEVGLDAIAIHMLGMGAMFHDIGKVEIPDKILLKTEPLTRAEEDFLRQHCIYGVDIGKRLQLPKEALLIIAQHHEMADGSGYPSGCQADKISPLSRVVSIVNTYDNLCNPINLATALTPHEALSLMFSKQRSKYDAKALNTLIRSLGVYPPGTVVKLSNEVIGMVMTVNSSKPLKPSVLIYDPEIPKEEAIILDLEAEPDINISKALRPGQLPRPIYEYLSPRKRVTYYFDQAEKAKAKS